MARREYVGGAAATTLASSITASSLTISLASGGGTGWPDGTTGKFLIIIDRGESAEEKILCLSRSGDTLNVDSVSDRGVDDTSAAAHSANAAVEHVLGAIDLDEPNRHINDTALDEHTQYMKADGTRHDLDARHAVGTVVAAAAPVATGTSLAEGVAITAARSDHVHTNGTDSVTTASIAANAVTSAKIAGLAVGTSQLASSAVTTAKITDANVTTAKLASQSVTPAKVGNKGAIVTRGTDQTIGNNIFSAVIFDTKSEIGGGSYDTSSSSSSHGFTCDETGVVRVSSCTVFSTGGSNGDNAAMSVYRDTGGGFTEYRRLSQNPWGATGTFAGQSGSTDVIVGAGDKLQIRVFQNTGSTEPIVGGSTLCWASFMYVGTNIT